MDLDLLLDLPDLDLGDPDLLRLLYGPDLDLLLLLDLDLDLDLPPPLEGDLDPGDPLLGGDGDLL